ncbi:polysaccharide pyruvyl transferase family protein [Labrys wisconsinensis]|uniref:Polysaccharide pyruvyl transferase domain-containing protein n=1 Tax=Labrys wisconsinensis TaxID=425677 RepID=A0ABU0IYT5_9HYPH|nr:polysaccharide pyruvyl transferase family protein [Labrys wisconsinensis]MDQ0467178.1 hypothetical protein [Labrys wisconsinensis]
MSGALRRLVAQAGVIPLAWGAAKPGGCLNLGDALSPLLVTLVSGLAVRRAPFEGDAPRLAAGGTIGQALRGGGVSFWGTGCSPWQDPSAPAHEQIRFRLPEGLDRDVAATRGPLSAALMGIPPGSRPHGDPVFLLPRFHAAAVPKRWDLGVIVHVSELSALTAEASVWEAHRRYRIPADMREHVVMINTLVPASAEGVRAKLDTILACRRLVSTSLYGLALAESYGIPCLYFSPEPAGGLASRALDPDAAMDARIVDLYAGLGRRAIPVYGQDPGTETDWAKVMRAVDTAWQPSAPDTDALLAAFPLEVAPIAPEAGRTVWDDRRIARLFAEAAGPRRGSGLRGWLAAGALHGKRVAGAVARSRHRAALAPRESRSPLARLRPALPALPLAWCWTKPGTPFANLGDALSAVIVCVMSGRPIARTNFHRDAERLVAVGTIAHAMKFGTVHLWGTGLDATRNAVNPETRRYVRPPDTVFRVHAVRGPRTAAVLRAEGIAVPEAYGDPVWFLPRIFPMDGVEKTHELGVILHLSELERQTPEAGAQAAFRRYRIPEALAGKIRIINTLSAPTLEALRAKTREIAACRRILSTSFHGMVIAEAYGIPCAWFAPHGDGPVTLDARDSDAMMDHRLRDFYSGTRRPRFLAYGQDRVEETDWKAAIAAIDAGHVPADVDPTGLFEAFPVPHAVRLEDPVWPLPLRALASLRL